ncbi:MAG TPA: hypothetical protein VJ963_02650 [Bacteroidales bacterium]|nr:hypothetical protein [Bacteroidales bacterium]
MENKDIIEIFEKGNRTSNPLYEALTGIPYHSKWTDFSPALMATERTFSLGGIGQVAKGVNAQGGLYALLKSRMILPVESGEE